jgi:hypothetical protein
MVIKRKNNINISNKWIEYIKSKSLMKKIEESKLNSPYIDIDDIIDINKLKKYTGNESIKAKKIYGQFDYKLIMKNNELPKYEHNDNTWRRIKIIPFEKK